MSSGLLWKDSCLWVPFSWEGGSLPFVGLPDIVRGYGMLAKVSYASEAISGLYHSSLRGY